MNIDMNDIGKQIKREVEKDYFKNLRKIWNKIKLIKCKQHCEMYGKEHIHLMIPRRNKEILKSWDKDSRKQDFIYEMDWEEFKIFFDENGILQEIDKLIEKQNAVPLQAKARSILR